MKKKMAVFITLLVILGLNAVVISNAFGGDPIWFKNGCKVAGRACVFIPK